MARACLLVIAFSTLLAADSARGQQRAVEPTRAFLVVGHPGNPVRSVSRSFLADAFLKRTTQWSGGLAIRPVDLARTSPVRRRFSEEILGRTVEAVRSYWQQVIFSGRGVPPAELEDDRAVLRYVASHPGAIGYVSGASDASGVEVIAVR